MLACQRFVRDSIEEFLLHPLFNEKIVIYGVLRCVFSYGIFGVREITEFLEAWRGILVMFGPW